MKKIILKSVLIAAVMATFVACKGDKNVQAATTTDGMTESDAVAQQYTVNTENSKVMWKGSKPLGSHNGTVMLSEGSFTMKDGLMNSGEFVIDMATIISLDLDGERKENLEAHLKGTTEGKEGDFFNINEYPTAKFKVNSSEMVGDKLMLKGDLTIKDKTHEIALRVSTSMANDVLNITSEPLKIDRTLWGINFKSKSVFDDLGDKFIDDEMELSFELEAKKS